MLHMGPHSSCHVPLSFLPPAQSPPPPPAVGHAHQEELKEVLQLVQPRSSFRTSLVCALCNTPSPVPTHPLL